MHLVDRRSPPFVAGLGDNVTFDDPAGDRAVDFVIRTVEQKDAAPRVPEIFAAPDLLDIAYQSFDETRMGQDEAIVHRDYLYSIRWIGSIPAADTSTRMEVKDPFIKGRAMPVMVRIRSAPPARVLPERLVLASGRPSQAPSPSRLMVITRQVVGSIEATPAHDGILKIVDKSTAHDQKLHILEVSLVDGATLPSETSLTIRMDSLPALTVPITIEP